MARNAARLAVVVQFAAGLLRPCPHEPRRIQVSPHDAPAAGGRRAAVRERRATVDAALEERLRSLGPAVDGEPDPAFRAATRARLVAMAAVRSPEPAAHRGWRRLLAVRADADRSTGVHRHLRRRLTAGLAGAALAVTALATLVAVSTGARPGDLLYGLKRGTEQTQLALAGDSRGQTLLEFAGTRLDELSGLHGSGDAPLAVETLHTMNHEATQGAAWLTARAVTTRSTPPVQSLASWAGTQHAQLAAMSGRLPAGARPAAGTSLGLLARIGARADALTAAVGCAAGPSTGGQDALGPIPAACPAPSPPGTSNGGPSSGPPQGSAVPPAPGSVATPTGPSGGAPGRTGTGGAPGAATGTGAGSGTGPGNGTGSSAGNGAGNGRGHVGGTGTILPTAPTVPHVSLPPLPLPLPLPGSGAGSSGASTGAATGAATTSSPAPGPGLCLPPLVELGSC